MIKIIPYRNKSILLKNNDVFVLKESTIKSNDDSNIEFNTKLAKHYNAIEEAIEDIDKEYFDKYELPTIVYQIIINPGADDEHIEELTDMYLAQELFDNLKVDPDPSYNSIKLVKFDYDNDSEEILDSMDFNDETRVTTESIDDNNRDDETIAKNFNLLGRLAKVRHKIDNIYNEFNEKPDVESLRYDLDNVYKSIEFILNTIKGDN